MKHLDRDHINAIQFAESLLGRREFILGAGGMVLTLGGFSLAGCGGVGGFGPGGGAALAQIAGTIGLPAGFSIPVTQLSVIAGLAQTQVKAPNAFASKIASQAPSLAVLQDSAGNGVMLGFLDPTLSNNTINAQSTGVALLYFMLAGYTVPTANVAAILNLISTDPSIGALAQVISTRIAADPHAVQNGDAQIGTALTTAYNSITQGSQPALRPASLPKTPLGTPPATLLIQPDGQFSGVEVLQVTAPLDIQLTNHFRRRCKVFIYKIGTQPSGGAVDMFPKVASYLGPIDLPTVTALGLIESLYDLFHGSSPLTPISIPPIPLTLDNGATKTFYEVVVLGPATVNTDPPFYGFDRYADQIATFRAIRTSLNIQALLADLVFGVFLEMCGMRFESATTVQVENACTAMAGLADAEWQAALALGQAGLFGEGALKALKRIALSSDVRQDLITALAPLLSYAQQAAFKAAAGGLSSAAFILVEKMILGAIAASGIVLGAGDIGAVLYSLGISDPGDVWQATAFIPPFGLKPQGVTISPGARVTFTITAPIGVTGNIEYDWTQTSADATFSASDGTVGNSIKTTSASTTVDLVTTPSDQAAITVTVIAYQIDAGGAKTLIGQVTAKVTFSTSTQSYGQVVQSGPATNIYNTTVYTIYGFATFIPQAGKTAFVTALGNNGPLGVTLTPAQFADPGGGTFDPTINFDSYKNAASMPQPYGLNGQVIYLTAGQSYSFGGGVVAAILFLQEAYEDEVAATLAQAQQVVNSINITFQ